MSAKNILSGPQEAALYGGSLLLFLCLVLLPDLTLQACVTLSSLGFVLGAGLRCVLAQKPFLPGNIPKNLLSACLPGITILVPLLQEAKVLSDLILALKSLDYPRDKVRILLLIEAGDHETRRVAQALVQPRRVDLLIIPDGAPRTKARACN